MLRWMSEERSSDRPLTHYMHSTPQAAKDMNSVPWLGMMIVFLGVVVVVVALIFLLA